MQISEHVANGSKDLGQGGGQFKWFIFFLGLGETPLSDYLACEPAVKDAHC